MGSHFCTDFESTCPWPFFPLLVGLLTENLNVDRHSLDYMFMFCAITCVYIYVRAYLKCMHLYTYFHKHTFKHKHIVKHSTSPMSHTRKRAHT